MATDALQTRLIEARAYIANLTQTLNRLEREATISVSSDDAQAEEQPFSVRAKGDAKLWRTDKRNGLTATALCKRHEDFHWLFDLIFDEDFRVPTTDESGACTVPRLSVKDIMATILRLYDRNEFVRDIYDHYALSQPLSLGYRAWMSYLTARLLCEWKTVRNIGTGCASKTSPSQTMSVRTATLMGVTPMHFAKTSKKASCWNFHPKNSLGNCNT